MKKNKKWIQLAIFSVVLVIGVLTIISNLSATSDKKYPQVGDKAPDFTLLDLNGQPHNLSDFKGKNILINFWGTFCKPCKDEMPALQRQYEKWNEQGVVFLAVNMDTSEITVQSFMDQYNLNLPVLLDSKEQVRKNYGVMDYPSTFFIGKDGKIVIKKIGEMKETYIQETIQALVSK
ncbi:thiol-disulfide oxidoreductase ResA [Paenibacillus eucommiae]|uniref:Peroxiredoxin n=1 Tax=Paenibacillus eucommiae TaxID=1355755 RepID=A0ABS4IN35_9BACL|nr:thiol-disulfide oxidoreductase ResA [Paenibacillus eucommiae]MBP1988933.1 peroxiredoxin [Paenibacillus eucommiae]